MIELHQEQGKAFFSDARETYCSAGIQGGKTLVGSLWLRRQVSSFQAGDKFIVLAPTYKVLNQSTIPTFLQTFRGVGQYLKGDQEFHCRNGAIGFLRTSTDPDSVIGIQDCRAAWMDESGKCKYMFYVNVSGRLARREGRLFCTSSAYARNWPYTEIIRPWEKGERPEVAVFNWKSTDNPTFSKTEYERQKKLLDPVRFAMMYMGEHAKRYGLVFDFPEDQIVEPYALPAGTKYYAAIDWGFSDPLAIVIRGITPDGYDIQVKEFYESGIFPDQIKDLVQIWQQTWKCEMWIADGSQPGNIQMLQRAGIPIIAGDRKAGDLKAGIDAHNRIIRSGKHKLFKTCKHTLDEYETYVWPDSEDEGLDAEDAPVDASNHLMDCNRMLSMFHVKRGAILEGEGPRVAHADHKPVPKLEYTHIPVWQRKKKYDKKYDEL